MSPRSRALAAAALAYAVAVALGALVARLPGDPLAGAALADAAATVVIFGASVAFSNSSLYDPYWSLAPPLLLALWLASGEVTPRAILVGALVFAWSLRLTWNFLRGWEGLAHEDWRYRDLREKTGRAYWLVSLLGIHAFPTLLTFAGSLALFALTRPHTRPLCALDALAAAVTLGAIGCEALADEELSRFRRRGPAPEAILETGLWRWSRHPNYFGEVAFWWGLFLFALAADPGAWWTAIGPLLVTLLFVFVSVPLLDRRMLARRPAYGERMARVSALVPLPPRRGKA